MELDWTQLLQDYGYLAVLIGTFFEGETVLLLGSFAVHQNILNLWWLILTATIGAFIGDQFYYYVGSKFGHEFIHKRPALAAKFHKASGLIEKYPTITILCMRFAWGLRTVIPISFGIKKYNYIHYAIVNIFASFIWAIVIIFIGVQVTQWIHEIWDSLLHIHFDTIIICTLLIIAIITLYKIRAIKN
jgi:membrane protein DedA with SNARE-associated domain